MTPLHHHSVSFGFGHPKVRVQHGRNLSSECHSDWKCRERIGSERDKGRERMKDRKKREEGVKEARGE